jgi:uncharacterized protein YbjT (DUF2867 family)
MILLAGGTGTLGRRLVQRLVARGLAVRILTRDATHVSSDGVEVVHGDVRDPASLERAMGGVQTVVSAVHGFAGSGGVSPASVDRDGNANLIAAAEAAGASFILVSVVGASADHPMELVRMKYLAEQRLQASGVPWTIVRATSFLETWIALLEQTASGSGRPLVFGRGENPINFVSVTDVAALLERVVVDPATRGQVLEIGGPENLSLNQLAALVQHAAGRASSPRHVPRTALQAMGLVLRPFRPDLARQAQAALVLDRADFAFDASGIRAAYPDLPSTTVVDVLDGRGRAGAASRGTQLLRRSVAR